MVERVDVGARRGMKRQNVLTGWVKREEQEVRECQKFWVCYRG